MNSLQNVERSEHMVSGCFAFCNVASENILRLLTLRGLLLIGNPPSFNTVDSTLFAIHCYRIKTNNFKELALFHFLDKYAKDDNTVKAVFDHLRNIGLIALVLGAAAWKQKHIGEGWVAVWDHSVVAVLGFLGFGLAWLNHENLFSKIRRSSATRWVKLLVALLYTVAFGQLVQFLQAGRA